MNKQELNETLSTRAKIIGACDKAMSKWTTLLDEHELIRLWKHNYEFAVQKDFPTNEEIKSYVPQYILDGEGVYVDQHINLHNKEGIVCLHGNTNGTMLYDGNTVATIHARHCTDLTISLQGMSILFINVYEKAKIHITQSDLAKVYVYQYGDDASVETEGDVRIRYKKSVK